jgi:hypothetical protein
MNGLISNRLDKQLFRFHDSGEHALIRQDVARKVIQDHRDLLSKGYAYPADWLYAYQHYKNIVSQGLWSHLCRSMIRQKPGLVSAINGKMRT